MEYLVEVRQATFTKTPEKGIALFKFMYFPHLPMQIKLKAENKIIRSLREKIGR